MTIFITGGMSSIGRVLVKEALGWKPLPFKDAIAETWADYQREGWTVHK